MQPDLDDIGGARELAMHRIDVAKDDFPKKSVERSAGRRRYAMPVTMMISI